jgi:hypothetical protein
MRSALPCLTAILAVTVLAGPLHAQRRGSDRAAGWIGVSFEPSIDRRGRVTALVITEVRGGSPADEAGVREGDRLLRVNDLERTSELAQLAERLRLRAGDRVRMVVERDGRRREFRLRATERPADVVAVELVERSFDPDSLVESMYRAMDSLRVRLVEDRSRERARTNAGNGADAPRAMTRDRVTIVTSGGQATVQAPFEFFVFRGEQHDSLRREMDALNRDVERLQRGIASRNREIERALGATSQVRLAQDAELDRLHRQLEETARRSQSLRSAMADAARATAGFEYSRVLAPPMATPPAAATDDEFRPLTPYLLGRNRVAGAEVIDLRPELAAYFQGVEGGVLVVDVAPQTPAAIAGIIPGDVITHLHQVTVRTVEDLRFGISQAGATLPITLVRRGTDLQVLLRR